ncbi:MAG: hypothetical protein J6N71_00135 [Muribaculaceae bacterium]|nr:hypothetical protein [Muribaculaceae bacterium]
MERQDVYIFNPENDLALAHGGENYTAPPQARRLRRDLQLLPAWLARPGSAVVVDDDAQLAQQWLAGQGLQVDAVTPAGIASLGPCRFIPWGWSRAMRRTLEKWGASDDDLPGLAQLDAWRALAHRRSTISMHHAIARELGFTPVTAPVELHSLDDVRHFAREHAGCYLKMPFSGSGRGVYRVLADGSNDPHLWQWAEGALHRQGSLMAEQGLDRTLDCAVELHCRESRVVVTGLSVFSTDRHCQYAGGRVDTYQRLLALIEEKYPSFGHVMEAVTRAATHLIAPHYNGPLGVDMLLYRRDDGTTGINPCVELNLRHTMGMVTAALAARHGMRGTFVLNADTQGRPLTPPGTHQAVLTPTL